MRAKAGLFNKPKLTRVFQFSSCLLVSSAILSGARGSAQTIPNVLTQHNDNQRTGAILREVKLNTSTVNENHFGKLFSWTVDGQVYAQPLYVRDIEVPNRGRHNLVFIATQRGSVYAFDADDN